MDAGFNTMAPTVYRVFVSVSGTRDFLGPQDPNTAERDLVQI